jgi:hypothetical protein
MIRLSYIRGVIYGAIATSWPARPGYLNRHGAATGGSATPDQSASGHQLLISSAFRNGVQTFELVASDIMPHFR